MKEIECAKDGRIVNFEAERATISCTQTANDEIMLNVTQDDLTTKMIVFLRPKGPQRSGEDQEHELVIHLVKQERVKKKTTRGSDT